MDATYDIQAQGYFLSLDAKCVGRSQLYDVFLFHERGATAEFYDHCQTIYDAIDQDAPQAPPSCVASGGSPEQPGPIGPEQPRGHLPNRV